MFLVRIKESLDELSKAERKVAEVVLADPEAATHISTAALAAKAGVSDPTVNRFCRTMDCGGFPDFKVQLAKSLAVGTPHLSRAVIPGDSPNEYINKLIDASKAGLEDLRQQLNRSAVSVAVNILASAGRIEIYGMGGSASIAQDAQYRFFRFGRPVVAYEDYLKMRMAASVADRSTVILFLSFTGRTKAMIDIVPIARKSGARTIAITAKGSPLAEMCDLSVQINSELENTVRYTPMTSRLLFLQAIDILTTGVALSRNQDTLDKLKKVKEALVGTKSGINPVY